MKAIEQEIPHEENECPRVHRRIACEACGYPESEARYPDSKTYIISIEDELADLRREKLNRELGD